MQPTGKRAHVHGLWFLEVQEVNNEDLFRVARHETQDEVAKANVKPSKEGERHTLNLEKPLILGIGVQAEFEIAELLGARVEIEGIAGIANLRMGVQHAFERRAVALQNLQLDRGAVVVVLHQLGLWEVLDLEQTF